MAATGLESLVGELQDAFLAAGHKQIEWDRLLTSPHLPTWALSWIHFDDPEQGEKLNRLWQGLVGLGDLLEIEVRDDSGQSTGRAMLSVQELRITSGQYVGKLKFVCSTDPLFEDWSKLHLNDLGDFEFHFCRKGPGKCSTKPRSKQMGFMHVSTFRVMTVSGAINHEYAADPVVSYFSHTLQKYMSERTPPGEGEQKEAEEAKPARGRSPDDIFDEVEVGDPQDKRQSVRRSLTPVRAREPRGGAKRLGASAEEERAPKVAKTKELLEDRARETKRAKEAALDASRALGVVGPQLVAGQKVSLREGPGGGRTFGGARDEGRGDPASSHLRTKNWLDDISVIGSDDPYGGGLGGDPPRGGDHGKKPPHDPSGHGQREKKEKKKKRDSSSGSDKKAPVRGEGVIAPEKDKKKRKRKDHGDPSSDPESSGSKKGRKDPDKKKKVKKDRRESGSDDEKQKEAPRRKRHRRKRRRRSSSERSSTVSSQADLYGRETSKYESLMEKARRHPGRLLRSGLEQMAKFMAARAGSEGAPSCAWRDQKVGAYLNQVLFNQHPPASIGMRNARELVTLAEAIDLLMEERLASLGDLLMQRLKAVEASLSDGWAVANYQELIPPPRATLTTDQERAFASRHAMQQRKLQERLKKKAG